MTNDEEDITSALTDTVDDISLESEGADRSEDELMMFGVDAKGTEVEPPVELEACILAKVSARLIDDVDDAAESKVVSRVDERDIAVLSIVVAPEVVVIRSIELIAVTDSLIIHDNERGNEVCSCEVTVVWNDAMAVESNDGNAEVISLFSDRDTDAFEVLPEYRLSLLRLLALGASGRLAVGDVRLNLGLNVD